jgi:hypothetical protein
MQKKNLKKTNVIKHGNLFEYKFEGQQNKARNNRVYQQENKYL